MANFFSSTFTPETALLEAQMRAIDANLLDTERSAGAAIQESREDLRRRRAAVMKMMGRSGGTSMDMDRLLSDIETKQMEVERGISQDLASDQDYATRMREQTRQLIPIRRTQELVSGGKDLLATGLQVGGLLTGNPLAAGAGAALKGVDVGSAMTAAEGRRGARELSPEERSARIRAGWQSRYDAIRDTQKEY